MTRITNDSTYQSRTHRLSNSSILILVPKPLLVEDSDEDTDCVMASQVQVLVAGVIFLLLPPRATAGLGRRLMDADGCCEVVAVAFPVLRSLQFSLANYAMMTDV